MKNVSIYDDYVLSTQENMKYYIGWEDFMNSNYNIIISFDDFVFDLDKLLEGIHEKVVIFLATDSKEVYTLLSRKYRLPIIMASYYSVGHSAELRGYGNIDYINRAMIDLQVLSNCDYLLTTFTSSFGNTASYLSHSLNKIIMDYKD